MNCHYCGTPLRNKETFCLHCGTRLQPTALELEEVLVSAVPEAAPEQPAVTPVMEAPVEAAPVQPPQPAYEEKTFGWQPYGGAPAKEEPLFDFEAIPEEAKPAKLQLPTKRHLWKILVFGILTGGIYPVVIWSRLVTEVNLVASRYDGKRSMPYFAMLTLSPFTLGIHSLVWIHNLCSRISAELQRRHLDYSFGPSDFWIWNFLMGALSGVCLGVYGQLVAMRYDPMSLILILPVVALITGCAALVFTAKLMKAMNYLNEDFNIHG